MKLDIKALFVLIALLISTKTGATDWGQRFEHGLAQCQAIPTEAYETGLIFNPAGYRSFYKQSRCLQQLALEWRDIDLCKHVKERHSLFFSSHAISAPACQEAVNEQLRMDKEQAQAIETASFHRLVDVAFSQPHYAGKDLMVQLRTCGRYSGSYRIVIEARVPEVGTLIVLDDYRQPLGIGSHELTRTLPVERLQSVLGPLSPGQRLHLRTTLTLPIRSHADHFVLALTPETDRQSTHEIRYFWKTLPDNGTTK